MKILQNKFLKAALLTLPLAFGFYYTTGFSLLFVPEDILVEYDIVVTLGDRISYTFYYVGAVTLLFLIFYKNSIDFFRKFIFIPASICFTIWFVHYFFMERGHFLVYTPEDINCGAIPFCHIVIPQTILPTILTGEFVFPGTVSKWTFSMLSMVIFWFASSIILGRGFCSWACFWGGWESGTSSILKKPVIKKIPTKLKYGAVAMLFSIVLSSLVSFTVVYCIWLCPFQGVSEFAQVTDNVTLFKFITFVLIFLSLVIVLPLLTKKRIQCISFCPFGAFQSLIDKISPIGIRVDSSKCSGCQKCIKECPMNAVTLESISRGKVEFNCVKCGKCVDICKKDAVIFHLKGTPIGWGSSVIKIVFINLAYFIMVMMLGGNIFSVLQLILGGLNV